MARLKILHVVVAGAVGGAERFLVNLATRPEVSKADHAIALMTPNPKLRVLFVDAGIKVFDRGAVRENPLATLWRSFGPADLAWLSAIVTKHKPDVLHCHTYGSHMLSARAGLRCGVPVLRTEHGTRHYRDPTCGIYRHWAIEHTTAIAAVSAYVAGFVAEAAPEAKDKIRVVLNGIDMARFQPVPPPQQGPFTFAAIGRLDPVKRLQIAIAAMAHVPEAHLILAGDGGERAKLEAQVRSLGLESRVRFLGHLSDPRSAITACDALINTTRAEGLPLAVLEGAAMTRPTLGFAGGGMPEVVQPNETGWLVRDDTPEAWASGFREAAQSREIAAKFGAAARRFVENRFDLELMCSRYGALYRDLTPASHSFQPA
ncbi:glycosyltransferase involved in cell wall biosynthesis [Rhizomicrobium palustre]|uniref:Glycosyltransferase involved in cell wall biosynthesis n=1 Tax=Rhizomicrobium palustre TaxID=189966 RepID=A0A846MW56_9PROT|nr:glycosyltransferase family 4 protein [Rhizomicrobium palustre]NIK87391.1 glycosyltransferase involved in cell wall biosynthesis [Rhizomicrobium palustre]